MAYKPINLAGAIITGTQVIQAMRSWFPPEAPTLAPPPPLDPMAGMATAADLRGLTMRDGAFYLGHLHPDHGASFPLGIHDDRHLFAVAQTRAGKGLSFLLSNVLLWNGPLFVIDPKGEAASIGAVRRATREAAKGTGTAVRAFVGQRVAILDPLGQVRGPARAFRVAYNPLADIDLKRGGGVRAIHAAAAALITPEDGNGSHFAQTAETLVAGIIEAVKVKEPLIRQTLPQCRSVLLSGFDALKAYLSGANTRAGLAAEAVAIMDEVGGDEWGSFRTTLSKNLKWLAEPDMADHLASSAFSLREAMQRGDSIFVCLPPEVMADFKGWLRVIVRTALDAKMALGTDQKGPQTLCILDEFFTLGPFPIIEESAGYMAGYGLKLVPVIQNIGQIQKLYPRNWETFLANSGAIIGFAFNDLETPKYFSDRLGRLLIDETSASMSAANNGGGGGNLSASANTARHERPVRFANEIHEQAARETGRAFVLPASGRGFTVQRKPYTDLPSGLYEPLTFIKQWEQQNW